MMAFNKFHRMPKIIMITPEDDLMRCINLNDFGLQEAFCRIIEWVMREHHRCVQTIKERLPMKCDHPNWPYFLWISPSLHKNYYNYGRRLKFAKALDEIGTKHKKDYNVSVLKLRQVWDPEDGNLFLDAQKRFTSTGMSTYWAAADKTLKYFATKINDDEDMQQLTKLRDRLADENQQLNKQLIEATQNQIDRNRQRRFQRNDRFSFY